jgi:peptide/nickel transport system substrate-binding protein/oligopeptide transport system substrate-binding protein
VNGGYIAAKIFNGLVRLGEGLSVVPDLAERWEISRDGLRYRFHIKKGIHFQNGLEVTARDFMYSFERVLARETRSPNTWVFENVVGADEFRRGKAAEVKGFRAVDDHLFEILLRKPFSPFLNILTTTSAYVVSERDIDRWKKDYSVHPSGTGPFTLREWMPNRQIVLERKEGYFEGAAKVRGIVYRIIPEDLTATAEFELGNLDVLSLPASVYSKFRKDIKWKRHIFSIKGLNTYYLGLNCSRPPFNNEKLRRAVAGAIDRKKILDTFFEGRGRLAAGPVPDLLRKWEMDSRLQDVTAYDPQRAEKLIREAGLYGVTVNMFVTADQDVVDLAEIIQNYLSKVGIKVNIKQLEWSSFKQAINSGEPDMFWLSWWADYPDPENFLFPLFHSSNFGAGGNRTRYVNQEVDGLIEKGRGSLGERKRNDFYKRTEELIIRDVPWVPFWHRTDYLVAQSWIKGYKVYPIYSMDKGTEIRIERGNGKQLLINVSDIVTGI